MPDPSTIACTICGNADGNAEHDVREMQFGTREVFRYFECAACRAWKLLHIPSDLAAHYPENYVSFNPNRERRAPSPLKRAVNRPLVNAYLRAASPALNRSIRRVVGIPNEIQHLTGVSLRTASPILDVGCGEGVLLRKMFRLGFNALTGVDKFVQEFTHIPGGPSFIHGEIDSVPDQFHLVMSHHSFEHMDRPEDVLRDMAARVRPEGYLLIRTPNADSWARREYGTDWYALDAPRHLYVHTPKSVEILAARCGLLVERVFFDSILLQFAMSEQYRRDIPWKSPESFDSEAGRAEIPADRIAEWNRRAEELNARGEGDTMGIILRKPAG